MKNMYRWLGLQLFAEGDGGTAAGTTGAAAGQNQQAERMHPTPGRSSRQSLQEILARNLTRSSRASSRTCMPSGYRTR